MSKGILSIIDVILALGQRRIAFRGNWDKEKKSEDGKFAFLVNWKSTFHQDLKEHLASASDNAKYTSPRIQNEIIHLCERSIREKFCQTFQSTIASWLMKPRIVPQRSN